MKLTKRLGLVAAALVAAVGLAACGNDTDTSTAEGTKAETVKIGYFPNMTHISTIIALEKGFYQEQFGEDVKIETITVSNGSAFMESMSTGAIDFGTVGPTPAINTFIKNPKHEIISGAVNGGAVLVAREGSGITSVADLDGKTVAIPTIGSTQDIMLMKALKDAGLSVKTSGGTVNTIKQAPADTASLFIQKQIDAAATQEPWGVNLEQTANATLVLGPEEFAWGNESTNTVLVATTDFTSKHADETKKALKAHIQAIEFIKANEEEAINLFIAHIKEITGKELSKEEVTLASKRLVPTTDVNEKVLQEMAEISKEAGYITTDDITGLINLTYLNEVK